VIQISLKKRDLLMTKMGGLVSQCEPLTY